MILGKVVRLSSSDQDIVSLWAAVKVVVARGLHDNSDAMQPEWIAELYRSQTVPDTWRVWLSACVITRGRYMYDGHDLDEAELLVGGPLPEDAVASHCALATFIIGHLGVKVLASRWPRMHGDFRGYGFLPIFPSIGLTTRWPPDVTVTDETLTNYLGVFIKGGSNLIDRMNS